MVEAKVLVNDEVDEEGAGVVVDEVADEGEDEDLEEVVMVIKKTGFL